MTLKEPSGATVLRGGDVARGPNAGSKRAFVTDSLGRIVKEITLNRVKVRVSKPNTRTGQPTEIFRKVPGIPSQDDLNILRLLE